MSVLPHVREALVDDKRRCTPAFYQFLRALSESANLDLAAQVEAIARALGSPDGSVDNIPPQTAGEFLSSATQLLGTQSVQVQGTLAGGLASVSLVGDVPSPESTTYYGTDAAGTKGFHPVASAFTAGHGITLDTDANTGVTEVAVARVSLLASGAISALRAIVADDGTGRYPNTAIASDAGKVVGISVTAAADGEPFEVLTDGEWADASWSWTPGPVFCGADGVLTQTPPSGWVLEVGRALSATRLTVDVKTPLVRA